MTHCFWRCGLSAFFSVSARSCCRWRARQCSAPPRRSPAASMSSAYDPWAAASRQAQSAWPLRRRRRCAFGLSWANACGSAPHPALPPPAADGCGLWCRCWCPAPQQSDYRSMPRRPSRRRPSAGCVPSAADGWGFALLDQHVEPITLLGAKLDDVFLDGRLLRGHDTSPELPERSIQSSAAESTTEGTSGDRRQELGR